MTINQALKEKNVLAGQVSKLKDRILQNNRFVKGEVPAYNTTTLLHEFRAKLAELVDLKTKIAVATVPMVGVIIHMAELKSLIGTLKILPAKAGTEVARYSAAEGTVYDVTIGEVERDSLVEEMEGQLRMAQDKLDTFNATTII